MKILHTITSMNPELGGVTEFVSQIIPYLARNGIDCDVACMDDPNDPWITDKSFNIFATGRSKHRYSFSKRFYSWLNDNVSNYDLVVINGLWQYHGHASKMACISKNIPYFVFAHGMLDPWFKNHYPLKHIKKLAYWLLVERLIINDSKGVIFTCEEEKILARKSFPYYHPNEYVSAFGTKKNDFSKELAMKHFLDLFPKVTDKKIVLFMGRVHEKKGIDLLINVFGKQKKILKDYILFIAGPDNSEYAQKLKKLVFNLNINDQVIWGGMLKGQIKWGAYYYSDVFCLPSHQENFGIVVAESLSASTPVIISNRVNIWREISHEDAGIICEDNIASLENALINWVEIENVKKTSMSRNALKCFSLYFDITTTSKKLADILIS
jgi:glycosyltransferase involved in cell wall biosynthesis